MGDRVGPLRFGHQLDQLLHAFEGRRLAPSGDDRLEVDVIVQPLLGGGHRLERHRYGTPVIGASRSIGGGPLPRTTPSETAAPTAASAPAGSPIWKAASQAAATSARSAPPPGGSAAAVSRP